MSLRLSRAALAAALLACTATPVAAQHFPDSYEFLEAVKKADGAKVDQKLRDTNGSIINAKNDDGEGALHIVAKRSDSAYLRFFLQKGANPNLQDSRGNTPMIVAVNAGFTDGVRILLTYKANVNLTNSSGVSPLILAVQRRDADLVRILLDAGADPDRPDLLAGMSARDYATQDRRSPTISKMLADAPKVTRKAAGPHL